MRDGIDSDPFAARTTRMSGVDGAGAALWVDDAAWDESALPRRPWVAPGFALRGAVTVIAGPPSAMKSSLMLAWACGVALGRPHGRFQPAAANCCAVYNVEDDETEQRRRLSAVLRQFDAVPGDIAGKLIRIGPSGIGVLFSREPETGDLDPTPAMDALRALLKEREPAVLIADPFAELHDCDENANTDLRRIVAEFRALAVEFNCAVILVHHTRKGAVTAGDPDAARGASAIIGAGRVVLTLVTMSETEAALFGMATDRKSRSHYVRLDSAKQNYAGIGDADWYEAVPYALDNGEIVTAVVPWKAPDLWAAVGSVAANRILDDIDAGTGDDGRYSHAGAAKERAAWPVVMRHVPSFSQAQAREILAVWLKNGVLFNQKYRDPADRKERKGLFVNHVKRPGSNAT